MTSSSRWFARRGAKPGARSKLFCLPYAGGGAAIYHGWQAALPASIDVVPVELPGRLTRFAEPPIHSLASLLDRLVPALSEELDRPFVLLGCSMGATLAFELARRLRAEALPQPSSLIVAARSAPEYEARELDWVALPDQQFLDALQRRYRPIPAELLADAEMRSLMLRVLRADFELIAGYRLHHAAPLGCPIAAIGGREDRFVSQAALAAWAQYTDAGCQVEMFDGGHFFIESQRAAVLAWLRRKLAG